MTEGAARNRHLRVLMVGTDLTSNGGIASVVKTYYRVYADGQWNLDLRLLKTHHYKDKGVLSELWILMTAVLRCLANLVTFRPDVVHVHSSANISFYRKLIFVSLCRLFRRPIILHLHASNFFEFFGGAQGWRAGLIRWGLGQAAVVVVLCEPWREVLESRYGLDTVVKLPNPIRITADTGARNPDGQPPLTALFLGFLIESKGVLDMLELGRRIKASGAPIRIVMAGKGELEQHLLREISQHQLEDVIRFEGWVSGQTKDRLLAEADVFLLPSYKEGMPIGILEAMNHGLPVVSTRIAGIPEEVEEGVNGFLLEPGDVDGLLAALDKLARDPQLADSMGRRGRERVARFSDESIFSNLIDIYQTVAAGGTVTKDPS